MTTLYDFTATTLQGQDKSLADYEGKVVLVVNTASKCGLTPQYQGLQELYNEFGEQGLAILGFPCDQFAHQEPGSSDDISEFCQLNYGVTFQMFAKVDVNGDDAHPLWKWLKQQQGGALNSAIKWNFTKFLINKQGEVVSRYAPVTTPSAIAKDIKQQLGN